MLISIILFGLYLNITLGIKIDGRDTFVRKSKQLCLKNGLVTCNAITQDKQMCDYFIRVQEKFPSWSSDASIRTVEVGLFDLATTTNIQAWSLQETEVKYVAEQNTFEPSLDTQVELDVFGLNFVTLPDLEGQFLVRIASTVNDVIVKITRSSINNISWEVLYAQLDKLNMTDEFIPQFNINMNQEVNLHIQDFHNMHRTFLVYSKLYETTCNQDPLIDQMEQHVNHLVLGKNNTIEFTGKHLFTKLPNHVEFDAVYYDRNNGTIQPASELGHVNTDVQSKSSYGLSVETDQSFMFRAGNPKQFNKFAESTITTMVSYYFKAIMTCSEYLSHVELFPLANYWIDFDSNHDGRLDVAEYYIDSLDENKDNVLTGSEYIKAGYMFLLEKARGISQSMQIPESKLSQVVVGEPQALWKFHVARVEPLVIDIVPLYYKNELTVMDSSAKEFSMYPDATFDEMPEYDPADVLPQFVQGEIECLEGRLEFIEIETLPPEIEDDGWFEMDDNATYVDVYVNSDEWLEDEDDFTSEDGEENWIEDDDDFTIFEEYEDISDWFAIDGNFTFIDNSVTDEDWIEDDYFAENDTTPPGIEMNVTYSDLDAGVVMFDDSTDNTTINSKTSERAEEQFKNNTSDDTNDEEWVEYEQPQEVDSHMTKSLSNSTHIARQAVLIGCSILGLLLIAIGIHCSRCKDDENEIPSVKVIPMQGSTIQPKLEC